MSPPIVAVTIRDALRDPALLGAAFRDPSWGRTSWPGRSSIKPSCAGRMPSYLRDWLRGIVGRPSERHSWISAQGVVVWKAPNARDDDAVVVLRLKDWEALHGPEKGVSP